MKELIRNHPDANIFCDETPIGGLDGIGLEDLKALALQVSPDNLFWIACNHSHPPKDSLVPGKGFYSSLESALGPTKWLIQNNIFLSDYAHLYKPIGQNPVQKSKIKNTKFRCL